MLRCLVQFLLFAWVEIHVYMYSFVLFTAVRYSKHVCNCYLCTLNCDISCYVYFQYVFFYNHITSVSLNISIFTSIWIDGTVCDVNKTFYYEEVRYINNACFIISMILMDMHIYSTVVNKCIIIRSSHHIISVLDL